MWAALLPPRGCLQAQAQDGEEALPGKYTHDHAPLQVENQPSTLSKDQAISLRSSAVASFQ